MRLTDLEPNFLHIETKSRFRYLNVAMAEADGIQFVCPKCLMDNGGNRPGVHSIICWQPHVDASMSPGPGRWSFEGSGYHDLTLRAGSSSILLTGDGCKAHFFITNGEIINA